MRVRGLLGRLGLACLIATGVAAAPPSVAAARVGTLTLNVTDCRTGQPIAAGYASFSAPLLGAVAPIDNGVAGPVGLGAHRWAMTVTSPGYRPVQRVLHGTGTGAPVRTLSLCMHRDKGSSAHLVTTAYNVNITCNPAAGEVCNPIYSTSISSEDIVELQFTAAATNCSAITLVVQQDGFDVYYSDPLGPGDSTPVVDVGPVISGTHVLTVQATGVVGGCNVGTLDSWAGTLTVWTVMP